MAITLTDAQVQQLQQLTATIVTDQQTYDAAVTTSDSAEKAATTADAAATTAAAAVTTAQTQVSADVQALNTFIQSIVNPVPTPPVSLPSSGK